MKRIILSLMLVALTITAVAQSANNIEKPQFPLEVWRLWQSS